MGQFVDYPDGRRVEIPVTVEADGPEAVDAFVTAHAAPPRRHPVPPAAPAKE